MTDDGDGETVTLATGAGATVTEAVPLLPSLVAVIVVVPRATALTTPRLLTVAIELLLDTHVTARFGRTFPFASFIIAESVVLADGASDTDDGDTVTVATGIAVTVTLAVPL
jgi:hypothetical protein